MAVKYALFLLNICILFNIGNCDVLLGPPVVLPKYNAFDWRLFQGISNSSDKNLITSPFSVKLLLTITKEAASGNTRNEIKKALGDLPKGFIELEWFQAVISYVKKESTLYEFNIASKVFLDNRQTPNPTFIETTKRYFHADTQTLNFADTKESATIINDWCSDSTKGVIKELVTEDLLKDARAVLTNAIYFKGMWEREFKKESTKNTPFYKNNGGIVEAPLMYRNGRAFFLETSELGKGAKLLRLPYKGDKFTITFILPKEKNGLDEVIASIKPKLIENLQSKMKNVTVRIYIPKFEFESKLKLKDSLQALNIKNVFTTAAELPGFGLPESALSDVIQKARITLNEKGTEVAVATAAVFKGKSAQRRRNEFKADHPFAFFIEENVSGALLFAGKVLDPTV